VIKTKSEIEKLKKAINISEMAYRELLEFIQVGMSEVQVRDELERLQYKYGAERMAFPTIVATGKNSAEFHHETNNTKIKRGDVLMIDFGCMYEGYHSDITRTIFVGKESQKDIEQQEFVKIYSTVHEALIKSLATVRDGVTCKAVDAATRDVIVAAGYGERFPHATGHGLGLEIHEVPRISFKSDEVLQADMVVTIEPGIYVEGLGGVRIEQDVRVTKDGCEILTTLPTKLTWI
jgi:Xaa-Pro aminopeptidase